MCLLIVSGFSFTPVNTAMDRQSASLSYGVYQSDNAHIWPAAMALPEDFHIPARRELKRQKRKLLKERSEG